MRIRTSSELIRQGTMAASESNPTYLIIGIVTFIVAAFLIGNVVACVSPARSRFHPSRPAALLNADARRSGNRRPPRGSPDASSR
jgi:hypothetical protein